VVAVLGLLALGGAVANRRRREHTRREFDARVEQANRDLAEARAQDRGWEPGRMEAAARRVFGERQPGAEIAAIELVQVVDRPGTEHDEAVYRVEAGGIEHTVRLGRRGDEWIGA
jgi:hypothetical protein